MKFEEVLEQFKVFMAIITGKGDIRDRINLLLNPQNPQTASKLTISQVDYLRNSIWIANQYPEFEPLKEDSLELAKSMISHEGWGVDKTIQLEESINKQLIERSTIEKLKEAEPKGEKKNEQK
jgi:hypothetical protein